MIFKKLSIVSLYSFYIFTISKTANFVSQTLFFMAKNLIRFDWAMKRLLRQKANFDILEGLLSELLKEDIIIDQLLESESNQEDATLKFNRVDILAINSKKEFIIIELQNNSEADYLHRKLYASSKVVTEHFNLSEPYSNIKKVYSINILYFNLGQGNDYVYHGTTQFKGIHVGDVLGLSENQKKGFGKEEVFHIYPEYYIIKVNNFNDFAKDTLDEWIYYLKNNKIKEGSKAKGLNLVQQKLEYDDLTDQEKINYKKAVENIVIAADVMRTARLDGKDEGLKEGRNEGRKDEKDLGIKKALQRGKLSIKEIAEDFEVTEAYVLELQKEL